MDVNTESIRNVQFREKVRGYHPSDVDAFVASVAEAFERLERRVKEAESHLAETESRASGSAQAEDSLRRTLILAQRTADAAVQEAREEAAKLMADARAQRDAAELELTEIRQRIAEAAEDEGRTSRLRFEEQRAALQADVDALEAHLGRERERLRIYFADQLRRVEEGEPGMAPPPQMAAPAAATAAATTAGTAAGTGAVGGDAPAEAQEPEPAMATPFDQATEVPPSTDVEPDAENAPVVDTASPDDDPFLAELRRAVNDEQPLGPRDDQPATADGEADDDQFDLFAKGEDDQGRFGSRLRRRR